MGRDEIDEGHAGQYWNQGFDGRIRPARKRGSHPIYGE